MSLRWETPCDFGECPYMTQDGYVNCEWWCGADEPQDNPEEWDEEWEEEE